MFDEHLDTENEVDGNRYVTPGQVGASRPDELFTAHDTTRGAFAPPVQAPSKQRSTHGSVWRLERVKVRAPPRNPGLRFAQMTKAGLGLGIPADRFAMHYGSRCQKPSWL